MDIVKHNVMLVKVYIRKHYKVYRIYPFTDDISNGYRSFSIFSYEEKCEVNNYTVYNLLNKLFGVEDRIVAAAFKEICNDEILKLQSTQLKFDYEGNSI